MLAFPPQEWAKFPYAGEEIQYRGFTIFFLLPSAFPNALYILQEFPMVLYRHTYQTLFVPHM